MDKAGSGYFNVISDQTVLSIFLFCELNKYENI